MMNLNSGLLASLSKKMLCVLLRPNYKNSVRVGLSNLAVRETWLQSALSLLS